MTAFRNAFSHYLCEVICLSPRRRCNVVVWQKMCLYLIFPKHLPFFWLLKPHVDRIYRNLLLACTSYSGWGCFALSSRDPVTRSFFARRTFVIPWFLIPLVLSLPSPLFYERGRALNVYGHQTVLSYFMLHLQVFIWAGPFQLIITLKKSYVLINLHTALTA